MGTHLYKIFSTVLLVACVLFLAIVTGLSFFGTEYPLAVANETLVNVNPFRGGIFFLAWMCGIFCCIALVLLLVKGKHFIARFDGRIVFAVVLVTTTTFSLVWVLVQQTSVQLFDDAREVAAFASYAVRGDWSLFYVDSPVSDPLVNHVAALTYFSEYPFQAGLFYYYFGVFSLFGPGNIMALQLINVVANEVAILCVYAGGCLFMHDPLRRNVLAILLGLCFPLIFSSAFSYGNFVGYALGFIFLYCQLRGLQARRSGLAVSWVFISLPFLALALMVKSTVILLAIAVSIAWFLKALSSHAWMGLVCCIVVLLIANSLAGLPTKALEAQTDVDFGRGLPRSAWFEIGLSDSRIFDNMPGWWDPTAVETFDATNNDYDAQDAQARKRLKQDVAALLVDPSYGVSFFMRKLSTEWCDPTYQSIYYSQLNVMSSGNQFVPFGGRSLANPLYWYMDGYQLAIYGCALVGLLQRQRRSIAEIAVISCFFAGFGCYLLWEAKSVYVFPFFVLLIPLAAKGVAKLSSMGKSPESVRGIASSAQRASCRARCLFR